MTKKQEALEFYNSYEWAKVSFNTFYQQCRWDVDWNRIIKPKTQWRIRGKLNRKGRYKEEIEWRDEQPEPKTSLSLFRNRLNCGYSKEEAMLQWEEWQNLLKEKIGYRRITPKAYTPIYTKPIEEEFNADMYRIDITYPPEVAKVFRREYLNLISEVENTLQDTEDKLLQHELCTKLDLLKAEVSIFNSYNKQ